MSVSVLSSIRNLSGRRNQQELVRIELGGLQHMGRVVQREGDAGAGAGGDPALGAARAAAARR